MRKAAGTRSSRGWTARQRPAAATYCLWQAARERHRIGSCLRRSVRGVRLPARGPAARPRPRACGMHGVGASPQNFCLRLTEANMHLKLAQAIGQSGFRCPGEALTPSGGAGGDGLWAGGERGLRAPQLHGTSMNGPHKECPGNRSSPIGVRPVHLPPVSREAVKAQKGCGRDWRTPHIQARLQL